MTSSPATSAPEGLPVKSLGSVIKPQGKHKPNEIAVGAFLQAMWEERDKRKAAEEEEAREKGGKGRGRGRQGRQVQRAGKKAWISLIVNPKCLVVNGKC